MDVAKIRNRSGFTMIEVMLGITISVLLTLGTLGLFVSYTGTLDEAGTLVLSKLKTMQMLGRMTPQGGYDGISRPYIKFEGATFTITEREMVGTKPKLTERKYPLKKRADNSDSNKIEAITDASKQIIYFDNKGLTLDQSGNRIEPTITITRTYAGEAQTMVINISETGRVTHDRTSTAST